MVDILSLITSYDVTKAVPTIHASKTEIAKAKFEAMEILCRKAHDYSAKSPFVLPENLISSSKRKSMRVSYHHIFFL